MDDINGSLVDFVDLQDARPSYIAIESDIEEYFGRGKSPFMPVQILVTPKTAWVAAVGRCGNRDKWDRNLKRMLRVEQVVLDVFPDRRTAMNAAAWHAGEFYEEVHRKMIGEEV